MRRALVISLLFFAACSSGTQVTVLSPDELPPELYDPDQQTTVEERDVRCTVYWVRDGRLAPAVRTLRSDLPTEEVCVRQLLDRPNPEELSQGFRTAIPPRTELLRLTVADRVANVNLSGQFEEAEETRVHILRIAQVVWTLTALPEVDAVSFSIHGIQEPVLTQEGSAEDVVSQARYSEFAPPAEGERSLIEGTAPPAEDP